ncbi:MAG: hypothetical protein M3Q55_05470 [Acidobacteriota bacterium]|nr:hypothetical protein [Acidobacteriota bacterium]
MTLRLTLASLATVFVSAAASVPAPDLPFTPSEIAELKRSFVATPAMGRLAGAPRMRTANRSFDWDVTLSTAAPEPEGDIAASGPMEVAPRKAANMECQFSLWDSDGYWTLSYLARLKDPNGQVLATQQNSQYKPSITGWMVSNAPLIAGQYRCEIDWYVNANYVGTGIATYQSAGQVPTSLNMYHTNTTYPSGYRYYTVRDYQVRDQNSQAIQKVMFADESFTTGQNTCGVAFVQGDGNTQSNGTFSDNLYMAGNPPACQSGNCTTVKNQTWKIDGHAVSPGYTLTYTCSGVTVQ